MSLHLLLGALAPTLNLVTSEINIEEVLEFPSECQRDSWADFFDK